MAIRSAATDPLSVANVLVPPPRKRKPMAMPMLMCAPWDRDLHSSTFRLDVSTFCVVDLVVSVTKTAQVELRSGRA